MDMNTNSELWTMIIDWAARNKASPAEMIGHLEVMKMLIWEKSMEITETLPGEDVMFG